MYARQFMWRLLLLLLICTAINNETIAQSKEKKTTFVLVHGAWHGGWCWQLVSERLRANGDIVHTPTLSGLGAYKHQMNASIDLNTHIQDIVNYIEMEDLQNVILVGHSYAGPVITGVADRIPQRLKKLVYLDAILAENGRSLNSYFHENTGQEKVANKGVPEELTIPSFPPERFGIRDAATQQWVAQRLTPQPAKSFDQPLVLKHPFGNKLPLTYIACLYMQAPALKAFATKASNSKDWKYYSLDTGHDAMITAPEELTALLQRISATH